MNRIKPDHRVTSLLDGSTRYGFRDLFVSIKKTKIIFKKDNERCSFVPLMVSFNDGYIWVVPDRITYERKSPKVRFE